MLDIKGRKNAWHFKGWCDVFLHAFFLFFAFSLQNNNNHKNQIKKIKLSLYQLRECYYIINKKNISLSHFLYINPRFKKINGMLLIACLTFSSSYIFLLFSSGFECWIGKKKPCSIACNCLQYLYVCVCVCVCVWVFVYVCWKPHYLQTSYKPK